jgi:hypothetical protein
MRPIGFGEGHRMASDWLNPARTDLTSPSGADPLREPPARVLRWLTASLAVALAVLLGLPSAWLG